MNAPIDRTHLECVAAKAIIREQFTEARARAARWEPRPYVSEQWVMMVELFDRLPGASAAMPYVARVPHVSEVLPARRWWRTGWWS
jgi:hypothetical protein